MALSLKSGGLADLLLFCIVVDDDGSTIVDLKGSTFTRHENVSTGAATWKGVTRPYFATAGSNQNAQGLAWAWEDAPLFPTGSDPDGCAVFVAAAGATADPGGSESYRTFLGIHHNATSSNGLKNVGGKVGFVQGGSNGGVGSTSLPANGNTKFSMGANWINGSGGLVRIYFGLESGSIAADSPAQAPGSFGSASARLARVGGSNTFGSQPFKPFIIADFSRTLTDTEWQSLHSDWFGLLMQQGSAPNAPTIGAATSITSSGATIPWADNSADETGFELQYRNVSNAGSFIKVSGSPFPANTTSAILTGLTGGVTYQARVRAISAGGQSSWSTGSNFTTTAAAGSATVDLTPATQTARAGAGAVFTLARSSVAPTGGVTYNLASSATGVATVPATVTIPAGQSSVSFTATAASVGSTTITATNAADSNENDSASLTVVLTKKLKLLAHIDALGATGVKGDVHAAPAGGQIAGEVIGSFDDQSFSTTAEGGRAVLKVDVTAFGGEDLSTSAAPVCFWQGISASGSALGNAVGIGSVGGHACTVIEE